MEFSEESLEVLISYYKGQLKKSLFNFEHYRSNCVAVAEHPDVIETMDKLVNKIATLKDKLNIVENYNDLRKEML